MKEEIAKLKRIAASQQASARGKDFSPLTLAQESDLGLLEWQVQAATSETSKMLFNAARQSGKSTVSGLIAVSTALSKPGSLVMLVSRTLPHAQELYRKAHDIYQAVGRPIETISETALTLELTNKSRIISRPGANDIAVRSFSTDLLIVDEASRVPDELYFAALPTLARTGGRLIALSTPWGQAGWFYEAWFNEGQEWERFEMPATELPEDWYQPSRDEFLAAERRRLGQRRFAQEYLCSFEGAVDSAFAHADIERAFAPTEWEPFLTPQRKEAVGW